MIRYLLPAFLLALSPAALAQQAAEDFAGHAVGAWSSEAQSADPAYDNVYSETIRIFPGREDGAWLLQQNWIIGTSPDPGWTRDDMANTAPYFQVVIQIRDIGGGEVHTTTWRLADDDARAATRQISPHAIDGLSRFTEDMLGEVACMGRMQRIADGFWEGAATCPNGYKGGVKVDSRSIRTPDTYVNWDRGFDASGKHIWGPASGGYIFKRKDTTQ